MKTEEVSAELLAQLSPLAHILQEKEMKTLSMSVSRLILLYDLELGKTLSEIRAFNRKWFY